MNVLHLTDLHYSTVGKDPTRIIKAIASKIKEENILIDFVFFTGDIVDMGSDNAPFSEALNSVYEILNKDLGLDLNDFIICPGNHDIDRKKICKSLKSFFNTEIKDNSLLNKFYRTKELDYQNSLAPLNSYREFVKKFYDECIDNEFYDLYSLHYRSFGGKKIAICSLYTPWLSSLFGDEDKGELLIPSEVLSEISTRLKTVDIKIILMHHPIYFLKEYNSYEVESIVYSTFNLLFSGHIHKTSSLSRYSGTNGLFEHIAMASLTSEGSQGCSIVCVDDVEDNKITVRELVYSEEFDKCNVGDTINYMIPCGSEKLEILKFRTKLHEKKEAEIENANKLLLIENDEDELNFLSLYNHPVIKKESENDLNSKHGQLVSLEALINSTDNYYILGKDKCGKTTLLKRIQIEVLNNFNKNGGVPFYLDARDFENKIDDKFSIIDLVKDYYGVNRAKSSKIVSSHGFVLLIDNFTPSSSFAIYLNKFLKENKELRFIACSEEYLYRKMEASPFGDIGFEKLFFHNLRKQEIVQYAEKRLRSSSQTDNVRKRIVDICKQLELPLNYWIVSLLLLIHHKSSESYAKNLFSILDVCVDEIFNKKQILLSHSKISYEQLKKVCAGLAKKMFENHSSTVYSVTYDEMTMYLDNIIAENDRLSISSTDIFNYLLNCGIIKEKTGDKRFVFRLNGFFEYFLAYQMTKDVAFREFVVKNDEMFIAFKNQIEIYCGFKRDDYDFLSAVYNKVAQKTNQIWEIYKSDLDSELIEKIKAQDEIDTFCRQLSIERCLPAIEQAKIEDQFEEPQFDSEVHLIPHVNIENLTFEITERYLAILARSYRSSDEISGKKQETTEIFHFLLNGYCKLGFYLVDKIKKDAQDELLTNHDMTKDFKDIPEIKLLNFISNYTPLICQMAFYDSIGHFSLERIIKKEIDCIIKSGNVEEYKLFMLCFLLLDIDLENNKQYITTAIQHIKMNVLRYAIVIKLSYYLAFNAGDSKQTQNMLSQYIQQAKISLDNKTSLSSIQQQIQAKKRENLINQNK